MVNQAQKSAIVDLAGDLRELSPAQQRLWFLAALSPQASVAYNVPLALRLRGALHVEALEQSLQVLVRRHESLRTSFGERDGRPVRRAHASAPLCLAREDLGAVPEVQREAELVRRVEADARRRFDLGVPPFRATLLRMGAADHVLVLGLHHIICDLWSLREVSRELTALYRAFTTGSEPTLAPLSLTYSAHVAEELAPDAQAEESRARALRWWQEKLTGAPPEIDLPTDRPRPATPSFRGRRVFLPLPPSLAEAVRRTSRGHRVTPFTTLLAGCAAFLFRLTGQEDLVVGTLHPGRSRAGHNELFGFLVNTLPLRLDVQGERSFAAFVADVRQALADAHAHAEVSFERIVDAVQPERHGGRSPLFNVLIDLFGETFAGLDLPGLDKEELVVDWSAAKFDLEVALGESTCGFGCLYSYSTDLFDEETIARMHASFERMLTALLEDPARPIGEAPLVSGEQRERALSSQDRTEAPVPAACIHTLVERQARRTPDAVAIVAGDLRVTYADLDARAERLAEDLRARGVAPDDRVGLCVSRSPAFVVGALAALKSGGAYVSLDPHFPLGWLRSALEDSGARALVTEEARRGDFAGVTEVLGVDAEPAAERRASSPRDRSSPPVGPRNLAYVVYTSGSTGTPKGVAVEHRTFVNLMAWAAATLEIVPTDRVSFVAGLGFDMSLWDIWPTLAAGASLHIPPETVRTDPARLLRWLADEQITLAYLPTPLAEAVLEEPWPAEMVLRVLSTAGDRLHRRPFAGMKARLLNLYGPSECHVVTAAFVEEEAPPGVLPSIGRPVANARIYILDPRGEPAPVGVFGELCVGGLCVGRGYLGRPDLTAETFVSDPFVPDPDARMYRTGDLARYLPDGTLDFRGRRGTQVKIRGYRVELGEIETVLAAAPGVKEVCVLAREDAPGTKVLVAYVVGDGEAAAATELRSYLRERLPDFMIPSAFVPLAALPLTANGKLDRRALPPPAHGETKEGSSPRTALERQVVRLWEEVLEVTAVGAEDDFFALGGHSLLVVPLLARLFELTGTRVSVADFFAEPTVRHLARLAGGDKEAWSPLVVLRAEAAAAAPLFFVHGADGAVTGYLELARSLANGHGMHALQARGLEEGDPCESVEEMAALYLAAVRRAQPRGPYRLGGWSMGGNVAFAMAEMLEKDGETVELLALVDSFARPAEVDPERTSAQLFWRDLRRAAAEHRASPGTLVRLEQVFAASCRALWAYRPRGIRAGVTLYAARERQGQHGWDTVVTGGVRTRLIPGDHHSILRAPAVRELARLLDADLAALERRRRGHGSEAKNTEITETGGSGT